MRPMGCIMRLAENKVGRGWRWDDPSFVFAVLRCEVSRGWLEMCKGNVVFARR